MRVLVLADAHIAFPSTPEAQAFLEFLSRETGKTDLLIIVGDLFEFFVGRQKQALKVYEPLLSALHQFSRSSKVIVLEGNHDFSLKGSLPPRCISKEEFLLNTSQGKILFTHGDTITTSLTYPYMRSILRSHTVRWLIEHLPPRWIWNGALHWARLSRWAEKSVDDKRLKILSEIADRRLQSRAEILVTGHLHRPFVIPLSSGVWIGLGTWQKERFYLELNDFSGIQCHRFPNG